MALFLTTILGSIYHDQKHPYINLQKILDSIPPDVSFLLFLDTKHTFPYTSAVSSRRKLESKTD